LYFPLVTTPVLSVVAGDGSADLTWTASSGFLGINVGSYEVGQSTTSGGSYSYTNVGAVLLSTRTGLTNGTTYYFVVRTIDGVGDPVVTSNEVSVTPTAGAGGGGGGGGTTSGSIGPGLVIVPIEECDSQYSADFNCDGEVDLVDFSILVYWVRRSNFDDRLDLNADSRLDLFDFSILVYQWTDI